VYFRYDRSLNNILFQAAATAVHSVLGSDTQTPALILTVQTAGEALNFNPHLHGLLASGTFDASGKFTPLAALDTDAISHHFESQVLAELVTRGLITDDDVAQILAQEHTGFGAWVGEPFEEAERTRFVARYIERGPVSLEKLTIQDDIITYTTKSDFAKATSGHRLCKGGPRQSFSGGGDERVHEFDAMQFLALLSCHIPKPYESITRYYGWYSCRARGERKKRIPVQDSPPLEPAGRPSLTWAQCPPSLKLLRGPHGCGRVLMKPWRNRTLNASMKLIRWSAHAARAR
jgi:hypothetical protein